MPRRKGLGKHEEKFAYKAVETGNYSEAYRLAYTVENMTPEQIWTEAGRIAKRPIVRAKIEELREKERKRLGVTAQRVLEEKARLAFVDVRKLFRSDGTLKDISEMDDATAAAIASLEFESGANKSKTAKVKLYDKGHALNDLMRHLGMFEKDNVQKADALSRLLASMGAIDGGVET